MAIRREISNLHDLFVGLDKQVGEIVSLTKAKGYASTTGVEVERDRMMLEDAMSQSHRVDQKNCEISFLQLKNISLQDELSKQPQPRSPSVDTLSMSARSLPEVLVEALPLSPARSRSIHRACENSDPEERNFDVGPDGGARAIVLSHSKVFATNN